MPMPSTARKKKRKVKLGEKPAMKLQTEYQRMEIINGFFRPTRSENQPEAVAPTRRIHSVTVNTAATAVSGTPNSCEIGHDQQEDGEIECIKRPAEPRRPPGDPLVLCRFFPPRDRLPVPADVDMIG